MIVTLKDLFLSDQVEEEMMESRTKMLLLVLCFSSFVFCDS